MSRTSAIAAFAARLAAVDNTIKVLSDIGNPVMEGDKKARYVVDGKYRAWEITCEGSDPQDLQAAATERTYILIAYGYFSFQSGVTEPQVQAICEAVETEFTSLAKRTYDGQFSNSDAIKVNGPKLVPFAGMVIHGVILTHRITDYPIY